MLCSLTVALSACESVPVSPDEGQATFARADAEFGAPSTLPALAASASRIDVTWQDNSGETGFEVHRALGPGGTFTLRTTAGANGSSAADSGLTPQMQYCFRARAVGG